MSRKLKVAYILSRFPRLTETFILREMLCLRQLGFDVHVFSTLPPIPGPVHEQAQEIMPYVHYSPFLLSVKLILAQFYFLLRSPVRYFRALITAIWQTYREPKVLLQVLLIFPKTVFFALQIQQLKIDHIHAHFVWVNGIAAKLISDLTGITFSLHSHAFDLFTRDQESVRRQLELAQALVTISEYNRRYIATLCPRWSSSNIKVVHCGLDPAEFSPAHIPAADNKVRILSVGSLFEKKGHEYLIEACAQLAQKGYVFQCNIVGDGYLRERLQERIDQYGLQETVSLLGPKKQSEVQHLYQHSDIFVLACVVARGGDRDGIPVVLLEAMMMQLPVVTTPVTGIPELVHHEETGLLVPERDVEALAQALERLINDKQLRCKVGQQGREAVLAEFDIHQTSAQMATIFQELHHSKESVVI